MRRPRPGAPPLNTVISEKSSCFLGWIPRSTSRERSLHRWHITGFKKNSGSAFEGFPHSWHGLIFWLSAHLADSSAALATAWERSLGFLRSKRFWSFLAALSASALILMNALRSCSVIQSVAISRSLCALVSILHRSAVMHNPQEEPANEVASPAGTRTGTPRRTAPPMGQRAAVGSRVENTYPHDHGAEAEIGTVNREAQGRTSPQREAIGG